MTKLHVIALSVALAACSKKQEPEVKPAPTPSVAKPVEAEPAKTEPAKPAPAAKTKDGMPLDGQGRCCCLATGDLDHYSFELPAACEQITGACMSSFADCQAVEDEDAKADQRAQTCTPILARAFECHQDKAFRSALGKKKLGDLDKVAMLDAKDICLSWIDGGREGGVTWTDDKVTASLKAAVGQSCGEFGATLAKAGGIGRWGAPKEEP